MLGWLQHRGSSAKSETPGGGGSTRGLGDAFAAMPAAEAGVTP